MNPLNTRAFWLSWNGAAFALGCVFLLFVFYCGIRWMREDRKKEREEMRKEVSRHDSYPRGSGDRT